MGESTASPIPSPEVVDLAREMAGGIAEAVVLARRFVNDETLPAYVRVRAMDFLVRNRHLGTSEDPEGVTLRDRFMHLLEEIRTVPVEPVVTTEDDEELEEDEDASFEAAPS